NDPSRPASDPPRFVSLESAAGDPRLGRPSNVRSADTPGALSILNVLPGAYLFHSDDREWQIKSVTIDGRDVTFTPVEITGGQNLANVAVTFTNSVTAVEGTVRNSAGAIVPGAIVAAFPAEHEQWTNSGTGFARLKRVVASSSGAFRLTRLPSGR